MIPRADPWSQILLVTALCIGFALFEGCLTFLLHRTKDPVLTGLNVERHDTSNSMTEETSSRTSSLSKYFVHGLAFSLIMLILSFGVGFLLVLLVAVGFILGLIVGLLILLMVYARINVFLMDRIWHVPVKTDWKSLLAHGLALIFVLFLVSIPSLAINLSMPNIIVYIITLTVYCPIDGYIAKKIAQGHIVEDIEDTDAYSRRTR
jgi:hypothetical protein